MVLEGRLADLLQGQAKKFINGFNAEHLSLGLLSGYLELRNLALNPEPLDELLLGSDLPFVVKAGTLSSAKLQLSLMQGELEIVVDGLSLVLAPACKWLSREEVYQHRTNEMERLEFVHMRSQTQRRTLEREMFRKLFSDYLSRIRIVVKDVHVRLEIEGEMCDTFPGPPLAVGLLMNSCDVAPVAADDRASVEDPHKSELLLAETVQLKGLCLYQESAGSSKVHVPWEAYQSTRSCELGIFQDISQSEFIQSMSWTKKAHAALPTEKQLMPATDVSIKVDLKSQALYTDCHVENCLTLEVVVCLQNPSRLRFTASIVEGMRWLVRRTLDFQMWPFLHALHGKPATGKGRWHVLRSFIALKRRIQSNAYSLNDAVRMRINCKEYIRLYKKKFNGPQSAFQWRRALPPLTAEDATTLGLIELSYPADKLVNFRMMAQTEMKTETSMNSFADEGTLGDIKRSPRSQLSWQVRELTPMEQLHLHGQHGFGTNIFRGLPPPPSNLKVRIDVVAPVGLWWVCNLGADEQSWAVAVDLARQPVRLLLVDSISDNSVFATLEAPRAQQKDRPLALLLGRSEAAFRQGSPGRSASGQDAGHGGTGREEWCSLLEFDGTVCCWGQVKTVPVSASHSPWDIFASFSCGQGLRRKKDTSFGRVTPLEELLGRSVPMCSTDSGNSEDACLRLNLPLRLPSGQEGPFVGLLKWSLAGNAPARSGLASLAGLARSGYDLAALRLHTSLPPLQLQGLSQDSPLRLPGFDAACHLENGGLVDGFVIGLHNLYNFANLLVAMPVAKKPQAANSVPASAQRRPSPAVQPLSLPLEQAPPMLVTVGAMLAAGAVVLAGGRQMSEEPSDQPSPELVNVAEEHGLTGMVHTDEPSDPMAGITLIPTLLAVLVGRRALWDRLQQKDDGDASEVFKFFAAMLQVLLAMGFPVHRCCLPLAAWVGSLELLQVLSQRGGEKEFSRLGGVDNLLSWAARGIYSQPKAQSEVLEWLCNQKADPNHRDAAGRSVLDWACWAGCEELVSMLLRRGRMATREPEVQLLLATSSRSVGLVRLLLRAAGDPHALPRGQSDAGHACGALLLAVRCCEYELACEMLKSAAFVNVDLALGASPRRERGAAQDEEKPAGAATRATIVLVESLRRFCSGLQRRSVEEVSVTGVRTHVPGPHPDECLYATPTMPLGDVLHPLAAQLPSPMHRVPLELRPGVLPMAWLRRTREEPWTSARMMVECFLQRGFKADEAFLTKVMPALPPEVQNLTRRLAEGGYPPPLPTLLTTMPDMRRASVTEKSPTTMYGLAWLHNGKTKLSKTFAEPAKDYWLRPKAMEDVKPSIANAADYMKVPWSPVRSGWAEEEASQLPAIRVVVLGAPRVGKSSVVQVLADYLQVHCEEDDGPAWLRVVPGRWPTSGSPVVQVCLWDTTSTFSPLPYLVTDPDAATFAVAVVDSFGSAETSDAVAMAQRCMSTEGSVSAPRRALVVENCFSGGASHMPDKALPTIQCSVMSEEGQNNLKRTFGKMIAEMVGQIEARAEASRGENSFGALAQCGQGDFRSVLARDTAFPCNARKPLGKRALAYRLRGDSTYVDPTAASIAWAAVCAARSTLPQEVQHLTGSSPSTSSWRMALVSQERLATVLELGHGRQSSATLQRALLDLGLICPVQAVDSPGSVLVPDFAERMKLSKALVQQMLDAASQVYVRVLWSHWERVPQAPHFLRTALQNLLKGSLGYSSTAKQLVLHHFALLEEDSGEVSDLGSGFLVAFELAEECCNRESFEGSLPELLGVPEITCVTVRSVSGGAWDVLCSGPHAHWAWHALLQGTCFAGFKVLASPGKGEADWPMPACLLSTAPLDEKNARKADEEEMAAAAWLLCGPQAKEARERLVSGLDRQKALGFAACCAAVLGRRPQLDLGTRNLSAEFEMCLLARSWHEMPYLLNEALLSVESWAICAAALARLARDAAVCAGRCGSQLPLLAGDSVALLPEGPQLLQKEAVELTQNVLKGDITPALQAWLTICRPIALWVWAGAAKGFCAPVGSSFAEEKLDVGSQVVKAVRAAVACFLSEAAILEVWDLLKDPHLGRMLLPRPGGGWMWLDPDTDWPL